MADKEKLYFCEHCHKYVEVFEDDDHKHYCESCYLKGNMTELDNEDLIEVEKSFADILHELNDEIEENSYLEEEIKKLKNSGTKDSYKIAQVEGVRNALVGFVKDLLPYDRVNTSNDLANYHKGKLDAYKLVLESLIDILGKED